MGDRVVVTAIKMISIGQIDSLVDRTYILDPRTLDVLWFLDGFRGCGSTCGRCAEPCLVCEKLPRRGSPGAIDIYDLTGVLLHRKSYDSETLSADLFPATSSTSHGVHFYVAWSSSYFDFPVFDRSGQMVFNTSAPRGRANEAFAFSDSIFLIPVHELNSPMSDHFLEVYRLPHLQPQDTIRIPDPGMLMGRLSAAIPPDGQAAVVYSSHRGWLNYVDSNLKLRWRKQVAQHLHHVAVSGDGRFIAVVGCNSLDIYTHTPSLSMLFAESGTTLWQTNLGMSTGGCYFAGPNIVQAGSDTTLVLALDSEGSLIGRQYLQGSIGLLWVNDNCITVSRSESDDNVIVSETWQQ